MTDTGSPDQGRSSTVFVVHGRNETARAAMFGFLRAIGLWPVEWSEAVAMTGEGSPYVGRCLMPPFAARRPSSCFSPRMRRPTCARTMPLTLMTQTSGRWGKPGRTSVRGGDGYGAQPGADRPG